MNPIVLQDEIKIPPWVKDFRSFRRWTRSKQFPEHGWFSHLNGALWVDLSRETVLHSQIKGIIAVVLMGLAMSTRLGRYFSDRMRLLHPDVRLSTEPDGMFALWKTLRSGRARLTEKEQSPEVIGSPDVTLEVVSHSSVRKDTEVLRELYGDADIPEYWLVDARQDPVRFEILRHTVRGYVTTRPVGGWLKSTVFGKTFQLERGVDPLGQAEYTLEVR